MSEQLWQTRLFLGDKTQKSLRPGDDPFFSACSSDRRFLVQVATGGGVRVAALHESPCIPRP